MRTVDLVCQEMREDVEARGTVGRWLHQQLGCQDEGVHCRSRFLEQENHKPREAWAGWDAFCVSFPSL